MPGKDRGTDVRKLILVKGSEPGAELVFAIDPGDTTTDVPWTSSFQRMKFPDIRGRLTPPSWAGDCTNIGVAPEDKETPVTDVTAAAVDAVDEELVRQLTERARAEGLQVAGEGGLLQKLTKVGDGVRAGRRVGRSPL
jgi:hypothetical protein